ncbi:hypothetical protein [Methylobacterium sp. WL120]|uniref:hypothetical protein n=1 Tax=Methylobacterium sp. WL120 TaxID=2603887 RepID=UPI0011C7A480|nr:hypothetical protein [Methylobacterium sp. WL120]TXM68204.1 hypothetical protein FV229_08545 [Methylobacterium sp. WL120]
MDVDPEDHNNLQAYAQDALDHVVADTLTTAQRYAGFLVSKTAITSVTVAGGRLYSGGKRFGKPAITVQDFITSLPIAGKKIVSVVVWGQEVDTNQTPREFLLNEETGASEPRSVAMTKARIANVQFASGTEAPDPTPPIIDVGYTRVANITLSTTGVEKIEMIVANSVENLDYIGDRTDSLELFEAEAKPKISTLSSDLAKLANQLKATASQGLLERMLQRLAVIEFKDQIPQNAVDSYADYFLGQQYVNLTHPLSHCKVGEGVRFPDYNATDSQLQIFDPLNPKVMIKGGVMFPAYDRQIWQANNRYASEAQVAGYSYQSFQMVEKTMSRQRVRYGSEFTVCTNNAFWATGTYDYFTQTFKRGDETFKVSDPLVIDNQVINFDAAGNAINHSYLRLKQIFVDSVDEPYWDKVTIPHTVNGAQVAETFLQGQDIWLDAVGLYFTRLANAGSMTVSICEVTKFGTPNLNSIISHTTLERDKMQLYPAETVVGLQPVFLQAGKRYAILLTTAADHWVGMTAGEDFTSGTFFYVLDGAYAQGDGTRDLMFNLYRAKFRQNRTVIEFSSLSLAGGMLSIDINADVIAPGSTQLTYEIQPQGSGTWYNLLDVNNYVLGKGGSIPVLSGFRAVMAGTVDMMPVVKISGSSVRVSRPDVTRTEISQPFTLPAASASIHVIERYEGIDTNHHFAGVRLRTGAGYNTVVNPSASTQETGVDELGQKWIERHYVFGLGAAVASYVVQHDATTDTPLITFHTAWMKTYGL